MSFLKWEPQHPPAILGNGLLYSESKAIVYGRYKTGKSILAQQTALCIADGRPWLGFDTPEAGAPVLYLQLEIPHPLLHRRVTKMWSSWRNGESSGKPTKQPIYYWTEPYLKLDRPEGLAHLDRWLATVKPAVLIIDPVYKVMSGNMLDPNSVRALLDQLDAQIGKHHMSIIMVSHPRKSVFEDEAEWGSDDLLGSVLFSAWADTVIKVTKKGGKDKQDQLVLNFDVVRHATDIIDPKEVLFDRNKLLMQVAETVVQV
jgi:RecA-family ATPase